jgi:hypothetical protein
MSEPTAVPGEDAVSFVAGARSVAPLPDPDVGSKASAAEIADIDPWGTGRPPVIGKASTLNRTSWWGPNEWKIPSGVHASDAQLDIGVAGPLSVLAGSVRGSRHRFYGAERQDAFAIRTSEPDGSFVVVAIADGVGSAAHSGSGARAAVKSMTTFLAEHIERGPFADLNAISRFVITAMDQTRNELEKLASLVSNADLREVATTLTFAIVPLEGVSAPGVVIGGVGDSRGYLLNRGSWTVYPRPTDAEISSTATEALPLDGSERLWLGRVSVPHGAAIMLATDGVGNALGDGRGEVAEQLAAWWSAPVEPLTFLSQLQFDRKSHDDDRTAAIIWVSENSDV